MDFRQQLLAAADGWPIAEARLIRLLANPRTPLPLIRQFALRTFTGASHFAEAIALLYCQADQPAAKAFLFENLCEETGLVLQEGNARYRPAQEHTAWARRFCRACGLQDAQLQTALAQAPRWPARAFALLAEHRWPEAVAYLVVGHERASPRYMAAVHKALLTRGFAKTDLVFFHNHIAADEAHGEQGLDILIGLAPSAADQARLLAQVSAGARDFWQGLNGQRQ